MCNCIEEKEQQLKEILNVENGHFEEVEIIRKRTYTTFEYKEGKRKKHNYFLHTYCPFCGQPYDKEG